MRVLFVIPALAAIYGGPSKIATALSAALGRRRGVTVDLVTTNAAGSENLAVPHSGWQETNAGYRLRHFQRLGRAEYKFSISLFLWFWRHVSEYDAVLAISIFNFPALACALACRARRVPYVINPQGMLEPWALSYKGRKKQTYYRWIERLLVLKGAAAIQALNENEAENIRKLRLGPPLVILPNGISAEEAEEADGLDVEAFYRRVPQARDKALILFMHRIDPKKGLDLLARSVALIQKRFSNLHVVVAGPDNIGFTETARGYFAASEVSKEVVTFTGMLEGAVKRGALATAHLFVLPSYSEGFSMAVLEAMAAGLPCVITSACNFPEAGEARVAKVVPARPETFAEALSELLASPKDAVEMGQRARAFVMTHYTWDSIAGCLVKILEDTIPSKTRREAISA